MNQSPPVITGISSKDQDRRVGATIRALMDAHRISRGEIAQALGVSGPYISLMCSGSKPLLREYLPKVADVLQVPQEAIALPEELKEREQPGGETARAA